MINYESPAFAGFVLVVIYVLTAATLAAALWSAIHTARTSHSESRPDGIPARRIAGGVALLLLALLALTALTASTRPLLINGHPYTDAFWLRVSDMLIGTSLALIAIAALATAAGMTGLGRRLSRRGRR